MKDDLAHLERLIGRARSVRELGEPPLYFGALHSHDLRGAQHEAPVDAEGDVLAYVREHGGSRFLVALNLGASPATLPFPATGEVALSTRIDRKAIPLSGRDFNSLLNVTPPALREAFLTGFLSLLQRPVTAGE